MSISKNQLEKVVLLVLKSIIKVEHNIYCFSGTKINLPLRKFYYKCRAEAYQKYYYNTYNV